ncbi:MAG: ATP-binding protein [Candidatus Omnitrophota bacterium]
MRIEFFTENLYLFHFICGLAFFTMGIAILVYPRRESSFKLSGIIRWLAVFGLGHALNEWSEMFFHIKGYTFKVWDMAALVFSYIFFFEFGRRLIRLNLKKFLDTRMAAAMYFFIFALILILKQKLDISLRYYLALPGGFLAAAGFILYYRDNRSVFSQLKVRRYFIMAAVSIGVYGLSEGIVIPQADSIIRYTSFMGIIDILSHIFHAICVSLLTWSVWNILGIFNWEVRKKLEDTLYETTKQNVYVDNIFVSIVDSLLVIGINGKIETVNPATVELLGYKEHELIGMPVESVFAEKETEEILNGIEEPAFLLSKDFKIIDTNNAFLNISGFLEKKDVINHYCYEVTHNLEHVCEPPFDRCPLQDAEHKNKPCVEMHKHIDKEGKEYLVNVTVAPVRDTSGEVMYYLHLTKNIRKQKEDDSVLYADTESMALLINKLETYARTLEMRRIFTEVNLNNLIARVGTFRNLEMYYKTNSGSKLPISVSGSLMEDEKGNFLGVVCVARDMREINRLIQKEKDVVALKAAAQEAYKKADQIEKIYNELEKNHWELKAAQAELIQAEKFKVVGRLASGVAHEVKNPLAIIIQGVEYLNKNVQSNDENVPMVLKFITDAVNRADRVIRGLLDFSSVSKLEIKPENLNSLIRNVLVLLKHHLDRNHIQLIEDFQEDIPEVRIDANRIEQIFVNLLLNAVQAMPEGGELKIKTYVQKEPEKEGWLIVQIEDNGAGIPADAIEKLFTPFFTTKRGIGGTGMGLSIVKNIVEMHGGKITIANKKEGQGAVVIVMFKIE